MCENNFYTTDFLLHIAETASEYSNERKLNIIDGIRRDMINVEIKNESIVQKILFKNKNKNNQEDRLNCLVYSPDLRYILCITCALFDDTLKSGRKSTISGTGMCIENMQFKNANQRVKVHVLSDTHKNAFDKYNEALNGKSINNNDQANDVQNNRHVLEVVIRTIIFLITAGE